MSSPSLSPSQLRTEIAAILHEHADRLESLTPKIVRYALETRLGLAKDALKAQKSAITAAIQTHMQQQTDASPEPASTPASFPREVQQTLNASKKRALAAAAGDANSDDDEERPAAAAAASSSVAKKARAEPIGASSSDNGSSSSGGKPGVVQLGGQKRVEVSKFKSFILVDIREMYTNKTSGEELPGKKGISLRPEQWATLLKNADKINAAIAKMEQQ